MIDHLRACVTAGEAVTRRVYEALEGVDRKWTDMLTEVPCILVSRDPVRYASPAEVVGDPGPLRGHLHALPSALAAYHDLVEALGIPPVPTADSALFVLGQIASEADDDPAATPTVAAVHQCWRILGDWLERLQAEEDADGLAEWERAIADELADEPSWPDRVNVLRAPERMFIDDLPAVRRFIPEEILPLLVDRPRFGLAALELAGLRFLSEAIVEEPVETPNLRDDAELGARLRARRGPLARVLSHSDLPLDGLDRLVRMPLKLADRIVVRRSIEDPPLDLGEHPAAALLDVTGGRLLTTDEWHSAPLALAVEITRVLCDVERYDPGVAANVEAVLAASSTKVAHDRLDLLQIAPLGEEVEIDETDVATEPEVFGDDEEELGDGGELNREQEWRSPSAR